MNSKLQLFLYSLTFLSLLSCKTNEIKIIKQICKNSGLALTDNFEIVGNSQQTLISGKEYKKIDIKLENKEFEKVLKQVDSLDKVDPFWINQGPFYIYHGMKTENVEEITIEKLNRIIHFSIKSDSSKG